MKVSGLQKVRGGVIKDTEGAESIDTIERDVVDAVQARLDRKRVEDALLYDDASNYDMRGSLALQEELNEGAVASREPPSSWAIANAAGLAATIVSFLAVHSLIISGVTFFVITFLASRDPLEEEGIVGSLARIIGRQTLTTIETTTPKVRSVARAVVKGDSEFDSLRSYIRQLESENKAMKLWIRQRKGVDNNLALFTLDELKKMAGTRGISHSGKAKAQLMFELVEAGEISLP